VSFTDSYVESYDASQDYRFLAGAKKMPAYKLNSIHRFLMTSMVLSVI